MTSYDEASALVRDNFDAVRLASIVFLSISMERGEGPSPEPDQQGVPVQINLQFARNEVEKLITFRVMVEIERADVAASVALGVQYAVDEPLWSDEMVVQVLAERIAIPAAYPYARAKIQEMTSDAGVPPVVLGMIDPSTLHPADEDDDHALATGSNA